MSSQPDQFFRAQPQPQQQPQVYVMNPPPLIVSPPPNIIHHNTLQDVHLLNQQNEVNAQLSYEVAVLSGKLLKAEEEVRHLSEMLAMDGKHLREVIKIREKEIMELKNENEELKEQIRHSVPLNQHTALMQDLGMELKYEREMSRRKNEEINDLSRACEERMLETTSMAKELERTKAKLADKLLEEEKAITDLMRFKTGAAGAELKSIQDLVQTLQNQNQALEKKADDLRQKLLSKDSELGDLIQKLKKHPIPTKVREAELEEENYNLRRRVDALLQDMDRMKENLDPRHPDMKAEFPQKDLTTGVLKQFLGPGSEVYALVKFIRESICDILFQLFVRSSDTNLKNNPNSYSLFSLNLKSFASRGVRGFLILLRIYLTLREILRKVLPYYGKLKTQKRTDKNIRGTDDNYLVKLDLEWRDNINKFVESSLIETLAHRRQDKIKEDKEMIWIYRLLAILSRTKYPVKGLEHKLDPDLEIALQDRICKAAHILLSKEYTILNEAGNVN